MTVQTKIDDPEVLYEVNGATAVITLNRPARMNTISGPMLNQLTQHLLAAEADPAVRAVLVWTDVPDLMELSADVLDAEIARLTSV